MGIYEVMTVTEEIRTQILQHASVDEIAATATRQGMRRLHDDGIEKVRAGADLHRGGRADVHQYRVGARRRTLRLAGLHMVVGRCSVLGARLRGMLAQLGAKSSETRSVPVGKAWASNEYTS